MMVGEEATLRVDGREPLAAFESVSRDFPPSTHALAGATFEIRAGESIAVVGPSGSGKSTLLALLGLLDTPTSGRQLMLGSDVGALDDDQRTRLRRTHIGFVFQAFHLIPHLTAIENVEYALQFRGTDAGEARKRAEKALKELGLDHRLDAFPATLSGGEQQRVAIARAVAARPALLLCDEPTGNLDSKSAAEVLNAILDSRTSDSAVVVVTHDPRVASRCTRRLHVKDGIVGEKS